MRIKPLLVWGYWVIVHTLHTLFGFFTTRKQFSFKKKKKAYLVGTPEHDNLGDHAIALSEIQFLEKYFPSYQRIEISVESWRKYALLLKLKTGQDDIFFMTGGGNMGNIYLDDEKLRRYIVSHFPDNRIVIFPQTVYFSDDSKGKKELAVSARIYNCHHHLLMCAREEDSFYFMKKNYNNCKTFLCPDMVFNLQIPFRKAEKTDIVGLCIRHDDESTMSADNEKRMISWLSQRFQFESFSTCRSGNILSAEREKYLIEILSKINSFSFIATNRLHAMIFSALAGTTCFVYPTKSPKISSTLKWLEEYPSIQLISNDFASIENQVSKNHDMVFARPIFDNYYARLANLIESISV